MGPGRGLYGHQRCSQRRDATTHDAAALLGCGLPGMTHRYTRLARTLVPDEPVRRITEWPGT